MDDIECHSYDEISAAPPMQITNVDDKVKLIVEEMLRFKEEVLLLLLLILILIFTLLSPTNLLTY